jgi:hypothetical protein
MLCSLPDLKNVPVGVARIFAREEMHELLELAQTLAAWRCLPRGSGVC